MRQLREAAPEAMDSSELSLLAIETLRLTFSSPESLYRFKHGIVARALRNFAEQEMIERVNRQTSGCVGRRRIALEGRDGDIR